MTATRPDSATRERWSRTARTITVGVTLAALALLVSDCGGSSGKDDGSPASSGTTLPTSSRIAVATSAKADTPSPATTSADGSVIVPMDTDPKTDILSAIAADGTVTQLDAEDGHPIRSLAWSPDGQRIAMLKWVGTQQSNATALYIWEAATGTSTQVLLSADQSSQVIDYCWTTPTRLVLSAYVGTPKNMRANGHLYVCDAVQKQVADLTDATGKKLEGYSVTASADGATVVFTSFGAKKNDYLVEEDLNVLDLSSKTVTTIADSTVSADTEGDAFANVLVAPDGSQVFTEQTGSDVGFTATVFGIDGTTTWRSKNLSFPTVAAWSPESTKVVFGGQPDTWPDNPYTSVFVYDSTTKKAVELTRLDESHLATAFAWSPDGEAIAYAAYELLPGGPTPASSASHPSSSSVWTMDADGSDAKALLQPADSPSWALGAVGR
jgi:Tol biopolymer transport system component